MVPGDQRYRSDRGARLWGNATLAAGCGRPAAEDHGGELSGQIADNMRLASDYRVSRDTVRVPLLRLGRKSLVRARGRARRVVPSDEREVVYLSGHEAAGGGRAVPAARRPA